jgi:diguanylate cyclase (GGDEF)-like protein/PAS domain S-box-containing protein
MDEEGIPGGLADRLFDGVVEIDAKRRVRLWNRSAQRMTGYTAEQVLGKAYQAQPARHVSEAAMELPDGLIPLLSTLRDGQPREALGHFIHADGYRLTALVRTQPLYDRRHKVVGAVEIFTDNKALIAGFQALQRTQETVLFDPLTGIGNRPHIEAKIRAAIEDFRRQRSDFGILFIDIDHFKDFNDRYGHLLGDKVLRATANTLRQHLRGSDSCGRWGGEEFVVLVHDLDLSGLAKVAEKLRQAVAETGVREKEAELKVTVSIGGSLMRPGDSLESLLERADRLMYESKRLGRNRVSLDPEAEMAAGRLP